MIDAGAFCAYYNDRDEHRDTARAVFQSIRTPYSHSYTTSFVLVELATSLLYKIDHEITLVDHLTGVLAAERDVEYVSAFDSDFRTLGFTVVPENTGEP